VARRQATSSPRAVSIATGIGACGRSPASGQQLQQPAKPGGVVTDALLGYQAAVGVDHRHVVVVL